MQRRGALPAARVEFGSAQCAACRIGRDAFAALGAVTGMHASEDGGGSSEGAKRIVRCSEESLGARGRPFCRQGFWPEPSLRYPWCVERLPSLRASDSDREQIAERLRNAMAEGRLSADELEERLESLFAARTYGELDALHADLPASRPPRQPRARVARWAGALGAITLMLAVLGVLASARVHSGVAAGGTGDPSHFRFRGPFAYPHHQFVAGPSIVGVFAVLLVFAALFWVLTQSTSTSDG
jgi:hypothetical protein